MGLNDELSQLASGFRQRYGKDDKLSIQDMIKLITPPKFNPNIIKGTDDFSGDGWVQWMSDGQAGNFDGMTVISLKDGGLMAKQGSFNAGQYTFSAFVKLDVADSSGSVSLGINGAPSISNELAQGKLTTSWQRVWTVINLASEDSGRWEVKPSLPGGGRLLFAGEKLEQGPNITPYVTKDGREITAPLVKI